MNLTFYGAAGEVTGSSHLLTVNGKRILLDCGLYQGRRKEAFEKNRQFPYDPASIDAMVLSHAHMDHSGNVPTLVKKGFRGKIWCTTATAELCEIMFRDSAHIQEMDVAFVNKKRAKQGKNPFEPLYTQPEAEAAAKQLEAVPYEKPFSPVDGVEVSFFDAGHILGSAFSAIDVRENGSKTRIMFTGDMGRHELPILRSPQVVDGIDYLITESTYGDRKHPPAADVMGKLEELVKRICQSRGKLIIPAFSIGRTQQVVYMLNKLYTEGRICALPVYVDSPLSSAATAIYARHRECWDTETEEFTINGAKPFSFRTLRYTESVAESKALNDMAGPMIIISASGMVEAGRILHHVSNNIEDPNSTILIVGYQAVNTLGRRIAEKQPTIKVFGEERQLKAHVETIDALSAHADKFEMLEYFERCGIGRIKTAFCVHGEDGALRSWAHTLKEAGVSGAEIPYSGQTFEVV